MAYLPGDMVIGDLAATVQAGHINTHPDPHLDVAPSTAAEKKQAYKAHDEIDIDDQGDEIPYLRFEQSYLHSIANADTWWKVMLITVRDQMIMPLAQGLIYNIALNGWQYSRRNARFHGTSTGARLRRWWYGVNNWSIPSSKI
ncbi:duf1770 domain containing protein [Ophiocordyceps camponoti-floridani]|uniref:Duf1770 domain containing protein n=1 Tax=Ophiocordyceps camponoti-floridani TaxID=2030778 RepID=A0A8H4Q4T9_9HYPO|nr:duf1770 domain containing protein [Ophiocordyceps camponoti-floridani]